MFFPVRRTTAMQPLRRHSLRREMIDPAAAGSTGRGVASPMSNHRRRVTQGADFSLLFPPQRRARY